MYVEEGCYHTEEKRRMKRRRGCKGCKGSPILGGWVTKIHPKSLSDPPWLRWVTHWLVVSAAESVGLGRRLGG